MSAGKQVSFLLFGLDVEMEQSSDRSELGVPVDESNGKEQLREETAIQAPVEVVEAAVRAHLSTNVASLSDNNHGRPPVDMTTKFTCHPKSLAAIASNPRDSTLRRTVVAMALDRFCKHSSLQKLLERKGLPTFTLRENPHLGIGHPPYDAFVKSLVSFFETRSDECKLFESFIASAAVDVDAWDKELKKVEKGGIETVFFGTSHAEMDAILTSGLDLNLPRADKPHYFYLDYRDALPGTMQNTSPPPASPKLLLFMTFVGNDTFVENFIIPARDGGMVDILESEYHLPIAEITPENLRIEDHEPFLVRAFKNLQKLAFLVVRTKRLRTDGGIS